MEKLAEAQESLLQLCYWQGGIVSIATRNSKGKGGNIAVIVLFGLGAIMGFTMAGSYTDLIIWAAWCAICAVLALISMIKKPKQIEEN